MRDIITVEARVRITIDIDPAAAAMSTAFAATASGASTEATNGGAAADSVSAPQDASGGSDAGGPPQWLLDSVGKAIAAAGDGAAPGETEGEDGGAGPG
jgi:hypothetical protein